MSKEPKMTVCRNCGTPIAKNARVCLACGAKKKKPFYKRVWFILLIVIAAIAAILSVKGSQKEKFDWDEVELCERLPKPKSNVGRIFRNKTDSLSMSVEKTSKSEYKAYIEKCEAKGYTIESEKDEDHYGAFDAEGYALSLDYFNETMDIKLDAPPEMGTLNWPKSEIAGLLPMPESTVGKVSVDTTEESFIYIGETSIEEFDHYADECSASGFSVDYERGDTFYKAEDANGNRLSLTYEGNNVMTIQIKKPAEEAKTETGADTEMSSEPKQEETPGTNTQVVDDVRPEFKEAMDSYETFMNEYCDLMKKYAESDGTDLGLLADYTEYMGKYGEVVEAFEAWESEELNAAETAYYLDVQTRINQKLLEVSQ